MARLNLLFLGSVSVLPFVTSLLRYNEPIAVQLYAGTIGVIFLLEAAMSLLAHRHGHHADPAAGRELAVRALLMGLIFLASVPLASIPGHGPAIAQYTWLALIPARWVLRLIKRARSQVGDSRSGDR
jgi:uncharacterized membrane protein